ncbi:MAG: serine hydrolase [Firmicutes bacterium]|nr:serine hydrolase [Bacillota bacterium]
MRRVSLSACLLPIMIVIMLLVPIHSFATREDPAPSADCPLNPADLEAFFDGIMATHFQTYHIPGAAVAVVKDGKILLAKGYGYADIETRTPVDATKTLFRIGSVSKLFTVDVELWGR